MPLIKTTSNLKLEKPEEAHNAWERVYWRLASIVDLWLAQLAAGHTVVSGGNLSLNGSAVDLDATTVAFAGQASTYNVGPSTPIAALAAGNTYVVYVDNAGAVQVSTLDADGLWSGTLPGDSVLLGLVYEVEGAWTIHNLPLALGRGQPNGVPSLDGNGRLPSAQAGMPTGAVIPFAAAAAPAGWLLCNGAEVSRATYAILFAVIGETYGNGDGSTTFNLPDLRGRAVIGLDNLGGTPANRVTGAWADSLGGAAGAETHTLTQGEMPAHTHGDGSLAAASDGNHSHTADGTLTAASNGNHAHTADGTLTSASNGGHSHTLRATSVEANHQDPTGDILANGKAGAETYHDGPASDDMHSSSITSDGAHTHDVTGSTNSAGAHTHDVTGSTNTAGAHTHDVTGATGSTGGGAAHNNMQPSLALSMIIKA